MLKECKIVLVTGGFDPIHSGHIKYFQEAKKLGDFLVVGINSDDWLIKKKGKFFLGIHERQEIIRNFRMVDQVITWNDKDGTAIGAIYLLIEKYPKNNIIFANGGDRNIKNIPEIGQFKNNKNIEFVFAVGGEKKLNSSSWILKKWIEN